jgi:histidinol phosphatase-like PHP family hydrolase
MCELFLKMKNGVVEEAKFSGQGCAISQASASLFTGFLKGKTVSEMYDLHVHSLLSDGEMIPIELVRRASVLGYRTIAIADHADESNIVHLIGSVRKTSVAAKEYGITLLTGVELTHVPPSRIPKLAGIAKKEGADLVLVHGETIVEPVAAGTNHAACSCENVDILAHPGLISSKDAALAEPME